MKENQTRRRQFLKLGGVALAMVPVIVVSGRVEGATNATLRTTLKYQSTPEGGKACSDCLQFVPGPSLKDLGGCKVIPGDTEISPQGYCMVWAKKG
jgi:hypothetical protein